MELNNHELTDTIKSVISQKKLRMAEIANANDTTRQNIESKLARHAFDSYVTYLTNLAKSLDCEFDIKLVDKETNEIYYTTH